MTDLITYKMAILLCSTLLRFHHSVSVCWQFVAMQAEPLVIDLKDLFQVIFNTRKKEMENSQKVSASCSWDFTKVKYRKVFPAIDNEQYQNWPTLPLYRITLLNFPLELIKMCLIKQTLTCLFVFRGRTAKLWSRWDGDTSPSIASHTALPISLNFCFWTVAEWRWCIAEY